MPYLCEFTSDSYHSKHNLHLIYMQDRSISNNAACNNVLLNLCVGSGPWISTIVGIPKFEQILRWDTKCHIFVSSRPIHTILSTVSISYTYRTDLYQMPRPEQCVRLGVRGRVTWCARSEQAVNGLDSVKYDTHYIHHCIFFSVSSSSSLDI